MKNVLFIGASSYNLLDDSSLKKKFLALSGRIKVFVLARRAQDNFAVLEKTGLFHFRKWNSDFYLLPKNFLFWQTAFFLSLFLCLSKRIDVVVCQSPLAEGCIGAFLKKILRKELIIEVHGDWIQGTFLSRKRRFEFLEKKIFPYLAIFSFRNADKIRAVSNFSKYQVEKIVRNKRIFVFPAFTDLDIFLNEKNASFGAYILFVGHLEKVKGVEYLIRAFNRVKDEFPNFSLVLVGKGGRKREYQLLAENYNLQSRIRFFGELPLDRVRDMMKDCYCLVLPSLSEGLGMVLIEAMALSKPVIASNTGGIPDLIRNNYNGLLSKPGDERDIADKLRTLLRDKDIAVQMGKNGKEFVKQNFSNEKYFQNYIEMINQ